MSENIAFLKIIHHSALVNFTLFCTVFANSAITTYAISSIIYFTSNQLMNYGYFNEKFTSVFLMAVTVILFSGLMLFFFRYCITMAFLL